MRKRTVDRKRTTMTLSVTGAAARRNLRQGTVKISKVKRINKTELTHDNQFFIDPLDHADSELEALESLKASSLSELMQLDITMDDSLEFEDSDGGARKRNVNHGLLHAPHRKKAHKLTRRNTFAETLEPRRRGNHMRSMSTLANMADLFTNFEKIAKEEFEEILSTARDRTMWGIGKDLTIPQYNANRAEQRQSIIEEAREDSQGSSRSYSLHSDFSLSGEDLSGHSPSHSGYDLDPHDIHQEHNEFPHHFLDHERKPSNADQDEGPLLMEPSETMRLIKKYTKTDHRSETFGEEIKHELDEDPNIWLLSFEAMDSMQAPADVAQMLIHLEATINLIDKYIPNIHGLLQNQDDSKMYLTAVIQELLKRAQTKAIKSLFGTKLHHPLRKIEGSAARLEPLERHRLFRRRIARCRNAC